jgi:diketogulonate reductase-like aldo/keto reductase
MEQFRKSRPLTAGPSRRQVLQTGAALVGGLGTLSVAGSRAVASDMLTRPIPSSGERIPAIGMGTWITFNVGEDADLRDQRTEVLRAFFEGGGGMIDSSPMYGSAEDVLGYGLSKLDYPGGLFSATKVWTRMFADGPDQMAESRRLWGLDRFDLMQVHNLVEWRNHLPTLRADREAGRVRYIGVTTSHGRRHEELENILETEPLDFVQLTYNILDREAEDRLLPLAADRGIAVIANRPFRRGALIARFQEEPLPAIARDLGCETWPAFLLKFITSHPALTCAIPATSKIAHMQENMAALHGPVPTAAERRRMVAAVEAL